MPPISITFNFEPKSLPTYSDEHLAAFWHIAQANPAAMGDRAAGQFAEAVGREIITRWLRGQAPALWNHQGHHADWCLLQQHADLGVVGKLIDEAGPAGLPAAREVIEKLRPTLDGRFSRQLAALVAEIDRIEVLGEPAEPAAEAKHTIHAVVGDLPTARLRVHAAVMDGKLPNDSVMAERWAQTLAKNPVVGEILDSLAPPPSWATSAAPQPPQPPHPGPLPQGGEGERGTPAQPVLRPEEI